MITPDDEQLAVLGSRAKFNAIDGNAGAAKTTTLALKLRDALRRGLRPEEALVLTYSPAAVLAFQQRMQWLGVARERILQLRIVTFDALCHERLRSLEGDCAYLSQPDRRVFETVLEAIGSARARAQEHGWDTDFEIPGEGTLFVPGLLHAFRRLKGSMALKSLDSDFTLTPASAADIGVDFTQAAVLRAFERLRAGLEHSGGTFRDSLAPLLRLVDDAFYDMACRLTEDDPVFDADSHPLRLGAKLVLVDEGHDLNEAMFTVLRHLVDVNPVEQLFVVGDVDQVVHSDSGADAGFMHERFDAGIGRLERFPLTTCRRFGTALAEPLSRHAAKRYRCEADLATSVEVVQASTATALAMQIQGAYNNAPAPRGGGAKSLAVLVRHPGESLGLEIELATLGFVLEAKGFRRFHERPEILFLRTVVAWATGCLSTMAQSDASVIHHAFVEFAGCTSRDITPATIANGFPQGRLFLGDPAAFGSSRNALDRYVDDDAHRVLGRIVERLKPGVRPIDLHAAVDAMGLEPLLKRALVNDEDVDDAMAAMKSFAATAAPFDSFEAWLARMNQLEFTSRSRNRAGSLLRMYTIPAAKGLEFDHVIVPNVDDGFDGTAREERNLFYVAVSRARKRLTMTFRGRPSAYLTNFGRPSDWQRET